MKHKLDWASLTPEERKDKVRYHANNCIAHAWAKRWLRTHVNKPVTVKDLAEMEADEA